jgi:DNA ligase (NAD+)
LLESLRASKDVPFERVLYGLGIRYVGETVAKKLTLTFKTIDRLREATLEELTATPDVGERIAASVVKYFSDPRNVEIVERGGDRRVANRETEGFVHRHQRNFCTSLSR